MAHQTYSGDLSYGYCNQDFEYWWEPASPDGGAVPARY